MSPRTKPPPRDEVAGEASIDVSPRRAAMAEAGKILARRAHSEHELRARLSAFDPDVIDDVIDRLGELGLVDDVAFAEQWVSERSARKGPLVLLAELEEKGVAAETAAAAVERSGDQLARAVEIAHRRLRKVAEKPLGAQIASIRGALLRRGFDMDVVDEASRAVLPPEGWD